VSLLLPSLKSLCQAALISCALACNLSVVNGQTRPVTDDDARKDFEKPGGARDQIFTKCGDLYYLGMFSSSPPPEDERIVEFTLKKPFQAEGEALSPAAVANHIWWQGVIVMEYSMFRMRTTTHGAWNPWGNYIDDITGPIGVARGTNQNGNWSWSPPVGLFFHWWIAGGFIPPPRDLSMATATTAIRKGKGQISCEGLQGDLTDAQMIEAQRLATKKEHEDILRKRTEQVPSGPAGDGFKFLYDIPLADRQYTGTVDGFAAELPRYFQQATLAGGMADRNFDKEMEYVINAVRTCAQITPQMRDLVEDV
jgi:hypothetical protein